MSLNGAVRILNSIYSKPMLRARICLAVQSML